MTREEYERLKNGGNAQGSNGSTSVPAPAFSAARQYVVDEVNNLFNSSNSLYSAFGERYGSGESGYRNSGDTSAWNTRTRTFADAYNKKYNEVRASVERNRSQFTEQEYSSLMDALTTDFNRVRSAVDIAEDDRRYWGQFKDAASYNTFTGAKVFSDTAKRDPMYSSYVSSGRLEGLPSGINQSWIYTTGLADGTDPRYEEMTDDEKETLAYYMGKDKREGTTGADSRAAAYLSALNGTLLQRRGSKIAENTDAFSLAVLGGLNQTATQIASLSDLITGGNMDTSTPMTYATQIKQQELDEEGGISPFLFKLGTTISAQLPAIAASIATGGVASTLGAGAKAAATAGRIGGNVFMGSSAASNAYHQLVSEGYTPAQGRVFGALVGASETLLGELIGGIAGVGVGALTGKSAEELAKLATGKIGNAFVKSLANGAIKMSVDMLGEGVEEAAQELLEPVFRGIITGEKIEPAKWSDAVEAGALGALSALVLNGFGSASGYVANTLTASSFRKSGEAARVVSLGHTYDSSTVAGQLARQIRPNATAFELAVLLHEMSAGLSEQTQRDISDELQARGLAARDADVFAATIAKVAQEGRLSSDLRRIMDSNEVVSKVAYDVLVRRNSTVNQRLTAAGRYGLTSRENRVGLSDEALSSAAEDGATRRAILEAFYGDDQEMLDRILANDPQYNNVANRFAEAEKKAGTKTGTEENAGEKSRTTFEAGNEAVTPEADAQRAETNTESAIPALPEPKAVPREEAGVQPEPTVSSADEVDYEAVKNKANELYDNLPSPVIEAIQKGYDGSGDIFDYYLGMYEGYQYGLVGISPDKITATGFYSLLTDEQKIEAYRLGEAMRNGGADTLQAKVEGARRNVPPFTGRKKGTVLAEGVSLAELRARFNDQQNIAFDVLSAIAEYSGIDIVLFESGDYETYQGKFDYRSDKLYIDVNAGLLSDADVGDLGKYAMLRTFTHEFVHFIEKWSPKMYNQLRSIVFETMEARGVDTLGLVDQYIRAGDGATPEDASREVTAEALAEILPDSQFAEEVKRKNHGLFEKIKEKLKEFLAKIKRFFARFDRSADPATEALRVEIDGEIRYAQSIVDVFDRAAYSAVENYQAANGQYEYGPARLGRPLPGIREIVRGEVSDTVAKGVSASYNKTDEGTAAQENAEEVAAVEEQEPQERPDGPLTPQEIRKLEGKGFNRWQKGNFDRLYIDPWKLYPNDSLSRKSRQTKTYIDVKTGEVHSERSGFEDKARDLLNETWRELAGNSGNASTPNETEAPAVPEINNKEAKSNDDREPGGRGARSAQREENEDNVEGVRPAPVPREGAARQDDERAAEDVSVDGGQGDAAPVPDEGREPPVRHPGRVPGEGNGRGRSGGDSEVEHGLRELGVKEEKEESAPPAEPVRGEEPPQPSAPAPGEPIPENEEDLERELEEIAERAASRRAPGRVEGDDYAIGDSLDLPRGEKSRFRANVDAIKLVKAIQAEGRQATLGEQDVLARYVGWGGLPNAFDVSKKGWEKEAKELLGLVDKGIITQSEYDAMRASTTNAHYTSIEVVRAIYDGLRMLGFKGGKLLEPSCGVGNFVGAMDKHDDDRPTHWTMVELDNITGQIAKYLYPRETVQITGFQNAAVQDNQFDAAIGNVPFSNTMQLRYDTQRMGKKHPYYYSLHNYFFLRALDKVRPGGIVAFITSSFTMDARDGDGNMFRDTLAEKAELLGAIRLPNTSFRENAGTEVVTDILVLRKRDDQKASKDEPKFNVVNILRFDEKTGAGDGGYYFQNEYYLQHPEMLLGTPVRNTMYGPDSHNASYAPIDDGTSLGDQIRRAFTHIKGRIEYPEREDTEKKEALEAKKKIAKATVTMYPRADGAICYDEEDDGEKRTNVVYEAGSTDAKKVAGIIDIYTNYINLVTALNAYDRDSAAVTGARALLNKAYDGFVKRYGYLSSASNKAVFRADVRYPFLQALEEGYQKADKKKGVNESATKARIFTEDTLRVKTPDSADNVGDAVLYSINTYGSVDLDYISELMGITADEAEQKGVAEGVLFRLPGGGLEDKDRYLSGNVRAKLAIARDAAESDPRFEANVKALEKVVPPDATAAQVVPTIGANWIPFSVYKEFMKSIGLTPSSFEPKYDDETGLLSGAAGRVGDTGYQYSTEERDVIAIFNAVFSGKPIEVRHEKSGLDVKATEAANAKAERMKGAFRRWLFADEKRAEPLLKIFNETMNCYAPPAYDGSALTVAGFTPANGSDMRPHQKNAVVRVMREQATLLWHQAGAGKSLAIASSIMKLRELGVVKKAVIIAPKNIYAGWSAEFKKWYPAAKILFTEEGALKSTDREARARFLAQFVNMDFDVAIMSYEQFKAIPLQQSTIDLMRDEHASEAEALNVLDEKTRGKKKTVKQGEKAAEAEQTRFQKDFGDIERDKDSLSWEQLGVDMLVVDEAHNFDAVPFQTKMNRIKGVPSSKSYRGADLLMKTRYMTSSNPNAKIVFATATPIPNSMGQLYVMEKYLGEKYLAESGIDSFDAWAQTYGMVTTSAVPDEKGRFKMERRFNKFVNVPSLMQGVLSFADCVPSVPGADIPVPAMIHLDSVPDSQQSIHGDYIVVNAPLSEEQEILKEEVILGSGGKSDSGKGGKGVEALRLLNNSRAISYSAHMYDSAIPWESVGKMPTTADIIHELYGKTSDKKGTQLVFIDRVNPNKDETESTESGAEAEAFEEDPRENATLHQHLKDLLVDRGIPAGEIALISDCKNVEERRALFDKVNDGVVRVLIGSRKRMGEGMNVQKRVAAIIHVDCPWRPADLEQSNRRGLRQGNIYDKVALITVNSEGLADAKMWSTVEQKQKFLHQLESGDVMDWVMDDVGDVAMSYSQIMGAVSGNPDIIKYVTLKDDVRKLELQVQSDYDLLNVMKKKRKDAEAAQELYAGRLSAIEAVVSREEQYTAGQHPEFEIEIKGKTYTNKTEAGKAFGAFFDKYRGSALEGEKTPVGSYHGHDMSIYYARDVSGERKYRIILDGQDDSITTAEVAPLSHPTTINHLIMTAKNLRSSYQNRVRFVEEKRSEAAELERLIAQKETEISQSDLASKRAELATVLSKLAGSESGAAFLEAEKDDERQEAFQSRRGGAITKRKLYDAVADKYKTSDEITEEQRESILRYLDNRAALDAIRDEIAAIPPEETDAIAAAEQKRAKAYEKLVTPEMERVLKPLADKELSGMTATAGSSSSDLVYARAVRQGDMETAQRMVDKAAEKYIGEFLLPDDEDEVGFKYHRGPAPTKTFRRYAVLNVTPDGFKAAYAGNRNGTPVGVWLDAQNLQSYMSDMVQFDDGTFASYIPGDTGASTKSKFSQALIEEYGLRGGQRWLLERGGKHSSDVPNFSQMNLKQDENGNPVKSAKDGALPHNKLIFEIEYGITEGGDLTDYVREHGRMTKGKNQGLARIAPNQYYDFKTNPNAVGNWGIGGTFRIVRLVPYEEVVSKTAEYKQSNVDEANRLYEAGDITKGDRDARIKNANAITTQKWVGGYHPEDFGLSVELVDRMVANGMRSKLTDAATYDDEGKLIPLSERFNYDLPDLRYQRRKGNEETPPEYIPELRARVQAAIRDRNNAAERFKRDVERLRKLDRAEEIPRSAIVSAVRAMFNYTPAVLRRRANAYDDIAADIERGILALRANDPYAATESVVAASDILAELDDAVIDQGYSEDLAGRRHFFTHSTVRFSDSEKSELRAVFDKDWTKYVIGKIRLGKNGTSPYNILEDYYHTFGGAPKDADGFEVGLDGEEGAVHLVRLINDLWGGEAGSAAKDLNDPDNEFGSDNPGFDPHSEDATAHRVSTVWTILTSLMAGNKATDTSDLVEKLISDSQTAIQRGRDYTAAKVELLRATHGEEMAKTVAEMETRFRAAESNRREREARAKYLNRIRADVGELQEWFLRPDLKRRKLIPDVVKEAVSDFLSALDFVTKRDEKLKRGGVTQEDVQLAESMKRVEAALEKHRADVGAYRGYADLPDDFFARLDSLIDAVQSAAYAVNGIAPVHRLDSEALRALSYVVRVMKTYIVNLNRFLANPQYKAVYEAVVDSVAYLESLVGEQSRIEKSDAARFVFWENVRPWVIFKRFGPGGEAIFKELEEAYAKLAVNVQEIIDYVDGAYTADQVKRFRDTVITVELDNGESVSMPVAIAMYLYLSKGDADALRHILSDKGGFRVAQFKAGKGKQVVTDQGHLVTSGDVDRIIAEMDRVEPTARGVADKLHDFAVTRGSQWKNDVDLLRFGMYTADNPNYMSIRIDRMKGVPGEEDQAAEKYPDDAALYSLLNASFHKQRKEDADNRIELYDVFQWFSSYSGNMAQYNAFALPILDTIKWLNFRQEADEELGIPAMSMRESMARAYGIEKEKFGAGGTPIAEIAVRNIIKALNGSETRGTPADSWGVGFLQRYNVSRIAFNARVVAMQGLSAIRAAYVLPPRVLASGYVFDKGRGYNEVREEMYANCGIALWKEQGHYDVNISRSLTEEVDKERKLVDRIKDVGLAGAEKADEFTWVCLYNACCKQAERTGEDPVALFNDVIFETQVVDTTITRSELMRRKDFLTRTAASFMGEPVASVSVLISAADEYARAKRRGSKAELRSALRRFMLAASVLGVSAIMEAAVASLFDALRDDDDDKTLFQKYGKDFITNAIQNLSPFRNIPYVSGVIEALEYVVSDFKPITDAWDKIGYDPYTTAPQTAFGSVADALKHFFDVVNKKVIEQDDHYTSWSIVKALLAAASQASGFGFDTAARNIVTPWNLAMDIIGQPHMKLKTYYSFDEERHNLISAFKEEDFRKIDAMLDTYYPSADDEKIRGILRDDIGAAYKAGEISESKAAQLLVRFGIDETEEAAHWRLKRWDYSAANGTTEGYKQYDRYIEAVRSGKNIREITREYLDNGVSGETLRKQITTAFKSEYVAADKSGKADLIGYLVNALTLTGFTDSEAKAYIKKWK